MIMTIKTLLKQLEADMNEAIDLSHEYEDKAYRSGYIHDHNSEAYYEHKAAKARDKERRLRITIATIKERVT